jgi:uncharacterized protein
MNPNPLPDALAPTVARHSSPCFVFLCWDGPDAPALRARDLDRHLAHVEAHWRAYVIAGPLRMPGEDGLSGSMFLVLAPDLDAAWAIMRGDPYITNCQYARIDVRHFTQSIGQWIGGKIWTDAESIRGRAAGGPPDAIPTPQSPPS